MNTPTPPEQCPHCQGRTFTRVDEQKDDGSFGPGRAWRCVYCEAVVTPTKATRSAVLDRMQLAAQCRALADGCTDADTYDRLVKAHALLCGQTPDDDDRAWAASVAPTIKAERARAAVDVEGLIKRFLAWPLPSSVCSDTCVSMPGYQFPRRGTNLLSAEEAKDMLKYVLAEHLEALSLPEGGGDAESEPVRRVREMYERKAAAGMVDVKFHSFGPDATVDEVCLEILALEDAFLAGHSTPLVFNDSHHQALTPAPPEAPAASPRDGDEQEKQSAALYRILHRLNKSEPGVRYPAVFDAGQEIIALLATGGAPASVPAGWKRLGDQLPEIGEDILLAHMRAGESFWRVRDACLRIRHEGVCPDLSDLNREGGPTDWWFDCIYPGKGDMRLARPDLLWLPMPAPALAVSPTPEPQGTAPDHPQICSHGIRWPRNETHRRLNFNCPKCVRHEPPEPQGDEISGCAEEGGDR